MKALPCPWCGQQPVQLNNQLYSCGDDGCPAYNAEVMLPIWNRRATTPAPVTEGAQREAVADDKPYVTFTREGIHVDIARYLKSPKGQAALKRIASTEPLYCENCGATDGNGCGACPAPPPPDRVQPERVEADYKVILGAMEEFVTGEWSVRDMARHVHHALLSAQPAPPTDASGGVTDAMVQAAREAFAPNNWRATCSPQCMRAALEAADRARKPDGYAYRYHSNFGDATVIHFNNGEEVNGGKPIEAIPYYFGAVIPDAGK